MFCRVARLPSLTIRLYPISSVLPTTTSVFNNVSSSRSFYSSPILQRNHNNNQQVHRKRVPILPPEKSPKLSAELPVDTLLFSTKKRRLFLLTTFASMSQVLLWAVMGSTYFQAMHSQGVLAPLWQRTAAAVASAGVASAFLFLAHWYPAHYIKSFVFNQRDKTVKFSTYTMIGGELKQNEVKLEDIIPMQQQNATSAKHWILFKIKNQRFSYKIDLQGEFHNKQLLEKLMNTTINV